MDYNSKYTGEQVEDLLDKINGSPEDIAIPTGNYPDMTVGKASQADTATTAINADNATKAASATTAEYATTAGVAESAEHATTAESATHAGAATKADFATDLSGRVEATPEVFTYRPSAGEKSIKDDNAFIRRVKGNSIVWNQMISTPPVMPYANRCNLSISGNDINATVNSIEYSYVGFYYSLYDYKHPKTVNGHTYFISGLFSCPKQATVSFGVGRSSITQLVSANTLYSCNTIQKQTSDTVGAVFTCWIEDIQVDDTFKVQNWNVIDLTQMFGAGNEPTTVEEFRALYPDSYYPYNAGELRNLDCNGIKTVGFNQWDEQWKVGQISSTTGNVVVAGGNKIKKIISKNYIPVLPNTSYFLTLPLPQDDSHGVYYYDGNKNYIGFQWSARDVNQILFTTPSNCLFIKFDSWGTTYNNNICINLHHTGWRDGDYEPYKEITHSLPLSQVTNGEPLRKAGSVYDEINESHYIKRVGVVDLGSLAWSINAASPRLFWSNKLDDATLFGYSGIPNLTCTIDVLPFSQVNTGTENISISLHNTQKRVVVCAPNFETTEAGITALKASLSGVLLHYELAEPIVTPIETPIDFNYYVEDFGTEEAILAEDSAPFSADIVYQFNATDQIRNNTRNIQKLQKSALIPKGTSAQYIRGDGSYGDRVELSLSQSPPINNGEFEITDEGDRQFILTPNYYAKSQVTLDNTTTIAVFVTAPENSHYLAEYWFEFAVDESLPNIEYYQPNNSGAVFRIDGDMMTYAVNILHLISSDGGNTFFGEIRSYSL